MNHNFNNPFVEGLAGYLKWAIANKISQSEMLATIAHDIAGVAMEQDGFWPKVMDYAKYVFRKVG